MKEPFIIIAFYTLDTPYQELAHSLLMPSVRKLGLHADIRGIQSFGSWMKNTAFKPKFILDMLGMYKQNLVYLDVDAEIRKYPEVFESVPLEYSIGVHWLEWRTWYRHDTDRKELFDGTMFIRNDGLSRQIISRWVREGEADPRIQEQAMFERLVNNDGIQTFNLPLSYAYIATLSGDKEPHVKIDDPVIVHHQASRKYRRLIV